VVSGHARRKVLRSLDAAGSGFDRVAGDRDRRARTARVGVQQILGGKDLHRRIGREHIGFGYIRGDGDTLRERGEFAQVKFDGRVAGRAHHHGLPDRTKALRGSLDGKRPRRGDRHFKLALRAGDGARQRLAANGNFYLGIGQRLALRIDDAAGERDCLGEHRPGSKMEHNEKQERKKTARPPHGASDNPYAG
jgi:hypothetical protein